MSQVYSLDPVITYFVILWYTIFTVYITSYWVDI